MTRDKVFICYSHRDKRWLERLQRMLKPLVRKGTISLWADTEIKAGAKWKAEIKSALASARVAVLLVSADFLASDFIVEEELRPLCCAADEEGVTILWVYLNPCHYEETPIGGYQAAHDVEESLLELSFPQQQRALLEISKQIKEAVEAGVSDKRASTREAKVDAEQVLNQVVARPEHAADLRAEKDKRLHNIRARLEAEGSEKREHAADLRAEKDKRLRNVRARLEAERAETAERRSEAKARRAEKYRAIKEDMSTSKLMVLWSACAAALIFFVVLVLNYWP